MTAKPKHGSPDDDPRGDVPPADAEDDRGAVHEGDDTESVDPEAPGRGLVEPGAPAVEPNEPG